MTQKDDVDAALDRALSDLLAQTGQEPVSPRLLELVSELNLALEKARRHRADRSEQVSSKPSQPEAS